MARHLDETFNAYIRELYEAKSRRASSGDSPGVFRSLELGSSEENVAASGPAPRAGGRARRGRGEGAERARPARKVAPWISAGASVAGERGRRRSTARRRRSGTASGRRAVKAVTATGCGRDPVGLSPRRLVIDAKCAVRGRSEEAARRWLEGEKERCAEEADGLGYANGRATDGRMRSGVFLAFVQNYRFIAPQRGLLRLYALLPSLTGISFGVCPPLIAVQVGTSERPNEIIRPLVSQRR
ncbi:hypothetical protein KM043_002043 [Ampulex compressa]|nr:hypothetical protein KM043_002043 [Ampulex compressa]